MTFTSTILIDLPTRSVLLAALSTCERLTWLQADRQRSAPNSVLLQSYVRSSVTTPTQAGRQEELLAPALLSSFNKVPSPAQNEHPHGYTHLQHGFPPTPSSAYCSVKVNVHMQVDHSRKSQNTSSKAFLEMHSNAFTQRTPTHRHTQNHTWDRAKCLYSNTVRVLDIILFKRQSLKLQLQAKRFFPPKREEKELERLGYRSLFLRMLFLKIEKAWETFTNRESKQKDLLKTKTKLCQHVTTPPHTIHNYCKQR